MLKKNGGMSIQITNVRILYGTLDTYNIRFTYDFLLHIRSISFYVLFQLFMSTKTNLGESTFSIFMKVINL